MSGKPSRSFGNISRERVAEAARRHGVRSVRVFGSVARGTDTQESDLDLLVEFEPGRDLFDLIELKSELEGLSGRSVDVVTGGHSRTTFARKCFARRYRGDDEVYLRHILESLERVATYTAGGR